MLTWIIAVGTLIFMVSVIWIARSRSNSNFQKNDFHQVNDAVSSELRALHKAGNDAALEAWYRVQVRRWDTIGWLHEAYARFLQHHGRTDEAVKLLESFIRRVRRLEDALFREAPSERAALMEILIAAKRIDQAERLAEVSLSRPNAQAYLSLAYSGIARDRGDHATAATRYLAALEQFPEEAEAAEGLVSAMLAQGLVAEAEATLRQLIDRFPRASGLAVRYARFAQDRSDWEEAAVRWAYVREQFVFLPDAYSEGAAVLRQLGRDGEAEAVLASRPKDISELTH